MAQRLSALAAAAQRAHLSLSDLSSVWSLDPPDGSLGLPAPAAEHLQQRRDTAHPRPLPQEGQQGEASRWAGWPHAEPLGLAPGLGRMAAPLGVPTSAGAAGWGPARQPSGAADLDNCVDDSPGLGLGLGGVAHMLRLHRGDDDATESAASWQLRPGSAGDGAAGKRAGGPVAAAARVAGRRGGTPAAGALRSPPRAAPPAPWQQSGDWLTNLRRYPLPTGSGGGPGGGMEPAAAAAAAAAHAAAKKGSAPTAEGGEGPALLRRGGPSSDGAEEESEPRGLDVGAAAQRSGAGAAPARAAAAAAAAAAARTGLGGAVGARTETTTTTTATAAWVGTVAGGGVIAAGRRVDTLRLRAGGGPLPLGSSSSSAATGVAAGGSEGLGHGPALPPELQARVEWWSGVIDSMASAPNPGRAYPGERRALRQGPPAAGEEALAEVEAAFGGPAPTSYAASAVAAASPAPVAQLGWLASPGRGVSPGGRAGAGSAPGASGGRDARAGGDWSAGAGMPLGGGGGAEVQLQRREGWQGQWGQPLADLKAEEEEEDEEEDMRGADRGLSSPHDGVAEAARRAARRVEVLRQLVAAEEGRRGAGPGAQRRAEREEEEGGKGRVWRAAAAYWRRRVQLGVLRALRALVVKARARARVARLRCGPFASAWCSSVRVSCDSAEQGLVTEPCMGCGTAQRGNMLCAVARAGSRRPCRRGP